MSTIEVIMSSKPSKTDMFADSGAPICIIPSTEAFEGLTKEEKAYAHRICRASFLGTRIVLRQTFKESEAIYNLIMGLHHSVNENWRTLASNGVVSIQDLEYFLEYIVIFLANVGNYRIE